MKSAMLSCYRVQGKSPTSNLRIESACKQKVCWVSLSFSVKNMYLSKLTMTLFSPQKDKCSTENSIYTHFSSASHATFTLFFCLQTIFIFYDYWKCIYSINSVPPWTPLWLCHGSYLTKTSQNAIIIRKLICIKITIIRVALISIDVRLMRWLLPMFLNISGYEFSLLSLASSLWDL